MRRRHGSTAVARRRVGRGRVRARRAVPVWVVAGVLPLLSGASVADGGGPAAAPVVPGASVTVVPGEGQLSVVPLQPSAAVTDVVAARAVDAPATSARVPTALWQAYAAAKAGSPAGCHLPVSLLAAIGQVESGSLAGRSIDAQHRVVPAVLGPVLDGGSFAAIRDTDGGSLDGDRRWDRAVGPMQFIPGTWARWGRDGDQDGTADPQDIEDAAASAAGYLCAGGRDLATPEGLQAAILSYNHSTAYLTVVLRWKRDFEAIPPTTEPITIVATPAAHHLATQGPPPVQQWDATAAPAVTVETPAAPAAPPAPVVQKPAPVEEPSSPPADGSPAATPPSDPPADPAPVPTPVGCPVPDPADPADPGDPAAPADPADPADPVVPPAPEATPDPASDPATDPATDPPPDPDPCAPVEEPPTPAP